jgi:hypothetical protein
MRRLDEEVGDQSLEEITKKLAVKVDREVERSQENRRESN